MLFKTPPHTQKKQKEITGSWGDQDVLNLTLDKVVSPFAANAMILNCQKVLYG